MKVRVLRKTDCILGKPMLIDKNNKRSPQREPGYENPERFREPEISRSEISRQKVGIP